jgi:hypothetical protein
MMAKSRVKRRAADDMVDPLAIEVSGANWIALRAFRLSQWSLIPGVGLVLGPVAIVLGLVAGHRGRNDPEYTFQAPTRAALVLGGLVSVTNWLGLVLIVLGWRSLGT